MSFDGVETRVSALRTLIRRARAETFAPRLSRLRIRAALDNLEEAAAEFARYIEEPEE
jgi:hypothetical protein